MILKPRFIPGKKVYYIHTNAIHGRQVRRGTVGMVRVEVKDSGGIEEDTIFDNFKPQAGYKEEYMLVENGIGSGYTYTPGVNLFATAVEADIKIKKTLIEEQKTRKQKAEEIDNNKEQEDL